MIYEIWHVPTANLVGSFDSKEEALDFARAVVAEYGETAGDEYLFGQEDKAGRPRLIAEGEALVARATDAPENGKPGPANVLCQFESSEAAGQAARATPWPLSDRPTPGAFNTMGAPEFGSRSTPGGLKLSLDQFSGSRSPEVRPLRIAMTD